MKWRRSAVACATVLTALAVTMLTTMTAKANPAFFEIHLVNTNANKCLGVFAGNMTNGTPAVQWSCNNHLDQLWLVESATGVFPNTHIETQIRDVQDDNKCLGVFNRATGDGANVVIWDCNGSTDQEWDLLQVIAPSASNPDGCYTIVNDNAYPKVLGILDANPADGAQAVIWDNLGHPDQVWCAIPPQVT